MAWQADTCHCLVGAEKFSYDRALAWVADSLRKTGADTVEEFIGVGIRPATYHLLPPPACYCLSLASVHFPIRGYVLASQVYILEHNAQRQKVQLLQKGSSL